MGPEERAELAAWLERLYGAALDAEPPPP
jgi:hypothetical protein